MAKEPVPIKFPPTPEIADAFARALAIASKLPEVEESRSYGTPAIRVKGKLIARLRSEDEGGLTIRCEFLERDMLMQADPETFYVTPHYQDYEMVLINLLRVRWDTMPDIMEKAWRMVAPKRLVKQFDDAAS